MPVLVGAYAVGGLFLGRALRSSVSPISFEQVLLVGGTSAAAAAVSPMITHNVVCRWSATAPLVNAAVSGAITYTAFRAAGVDGDSSAMFVPVQMASSLLAEYVAHELQKAELNKKKDAMTS